MVELVKLTPTITLDDYAAVAYLAGAVQELRDEAESFLPRFKGRSVLMLSSTAKGGGVAEMLPRIVLILNELGISTQWAVMGTEEPAFFRFTKRLHNLIHGQGDPTITDQERQLYEQVNRTIADEVRPHLKPNDLLITHDPQPLAASALLKKELAIDALWRCHIGLDVDLPATSAAWSFLRPYAETHDYSVFSAPEYIPSYLAGRASIIYPGIDPLGHKNRPLFPDKLTGVLCNAGLATEHAPVLTPPFPQRAQRLQPDGSLGPATLPDEIGLLYRPIVAQVSRWDRLKGFQPLLAGFVRLKRKLRAGTATWSPRDHRRMEIVRLVLAGPDPGAVQDDPESSELFNRLRNDYCSLEPEVQKDIAILCLPMDSRKNNELMVNAIQRCAAIVVQNSLREGFGLTATEAMWKGTPVLGTQAVGLRHQIRDGIDGHLLNNPEDPQEIADTLEQMLADDAARERWSRNAQKRVFTEFLVFTQVQRWLHVLATCCTSRARQESKPLHAQHTPAKT
ncbi:MAG: glycosyltransferase [Bacillota bacterium]